MTISASLVLVALLIRGRLREATHTRMHLATRLAQRTRTGWEEAYHVRKLIVDAVVLQNIHV